MRGRRYGIAAIVLALLVVAAACGGATPTPAPAATQAPAMTATPVAATPAPTAPPKKITLKAAHWLALSHSFHLTVVQFADAVNERTNGQVEIEIFPTGTLLKGREILEGIRKEIVDMAPVASFYYPGDFPFAGDAGMMPFGWTAKEAPQIVEAMRPIYGSELALHNARVLFFTPINTDWFTSKRVDPNNPDFSGMTFRSIGATYDKVIETLGGTPASMPSGEITMAIRTGVVEGFTTSYQSYNGFDLWNDAPYIYDTGAGFLAMSVAWAITDKAWNSLPPDVQQIMIEEGKNAEAWMLEKSAGLDEEVKVKARQKMAAGEKVELITLTPEQRVIWRNKLAPVWDSFVEKHGQRGQVWVDTVKKISGITD